VEGVRLLRQGVATTVINTGVVFCFIEAAVKMG
jgi:hypothetical protein